jgi:excinuclease ABC subunit A
MRAGWCCIPEASLAEGAIRGWDRRNVYYFHLLRSLSKHYDFDMDKPFEKLSQKHRDIILYGSDGEEIEFSYVNDRGTVFKRRHVFRGRNPQHGSPLPGDRVLLGEG